MSEVTTYNHMDHARWIESNYKVKCSPLGRRVAYIIGVTFGGIYNAPVFRGRVAWSAPNGIEVLLRHNHDVATYDYSSLTTLVLICHELSIRVAIHPKMIGYKYKDGSRDYESAEVIFEPSEDGLMPDAYMQVPVIELHFWQRDPNGKEWHDRHPTIDGAVAAFREWFDPFARRIADGAAETVIANAEPTPIESPA